MSASQPIVFWSPSTPRFTSSELPEIADSLKRLADAAEAQHSPSSVPLKKR
jgi:hypothetical protein